MTVDSMSWETAGIVDSVAEVDKLKAANRALLIQALALRGVDADEGFFRHAVRRDAAKLRTRSGRAVIVATRWRRTGT